MKNIVIVFVLALMSVPVYSANIYISGDAPWNFLSIEGEIERGDYQKVLTLVKEHNIIPDSLSISSPGGDVVEAIKIGRFARKHLVGFSLSKQCDSACVFVYIGSIRGMVDPWGKFGLHRPYFDKTYFSSLNAERAADRYDELRKEVKDYLDDMGAPQALIDRIFKIPSKSVEYATSEEMISILGRYPPAYEEWVASKCGSLSDHELDDLGKLVRTKHLFSPGYISYLEKKRDGLSDCARKARESERKRLIKKLSL